jgi:small subunit ribosomal protein S18
MAIDEMAKQASAGESEVKFLTPLDITTKSEKNIVDSKNSELST